MVKSHMRTEADFKLSNSWRIFPGFFADFIDTEELRQDPVLRGITFHFVVGSVEEDRKVMGLILQPTGVSDQYRRVGMFVHPYRHGEDGFVRPWQNPPKEAVKEEDFPEFVDFDPDNFEMSTTVTII
jgi:hypothetical protein